MAPTASASASSEPPLASATAPSPDAQTPEVVQESMYPSVGQVGAWVESIVYSFAVDSVTRCQSTTDDAGPARAGAFEGGAASNDDVMVGVKVRIRAKGDRLFAKPRDVKLVHGGIILDASPVEGGPRCQPMLKPAPITSGHVAGGYVIFQVPPALAEKPLTVDYRPTRWGGADSVHVPLPACLDCADGARKTKVKP